MAFQTFETLELDKTLKEKVRYVLLKSVVEKKLPVAGNHAGYSTVNQFISDTLKKVNGISESDLKINCWKNYETVKQIVQKEIVTKSSQELKEMFDELHKCAVKEIVSTNPRTDYGDLINNVNLQLVESFLKRVAVFIKTNLSSIDKYEGQMLFLKIIEMFSYKQLGVVLHSMWEFFEQDKKPKKAELKDARAVIKSVDYLQDFVSGTFCPLCSKFPRRERNDTKSLTNHLREVHSVLFFPCPQANCSEKFKSVKSLNTHLEGKHDILVHNCKEPECERSFETKKKLAAHMIEDHNCNYRDRNITEKNKKKLAEARAEISEKKSCPPRVSVTGQVAQTSSPPKKILCAFCGNVHSIVSAFLLCYDIEKLTIEEIKLLVFELRKENWTLRQKLCSTAADDPFDEASSADVLRPPHIVSVEPDCEPVQHEQILGYPGVLAKVGELGLIEKLFYLDLGFRPEAIPDNLPTFLTDQEVLQELCTKKKPLHEEESCFDGGKEFLNEEDSLRTDYGKESSFEEGKESSFDEGKDTCFCGGKGYLNEEESSPIEDGKEVSSSPIEDVKEVSSSLYIATASNTENDFLENEDNENIDGMLEDFVNNINFSNFNGTQSDLEPIIGGAVESNLQCFAITDLSELEEETDKENSPQKDTMFNNVNGRKRSVEVVCREASDLEHETTERSPTKLFTSTERSPAKLLTLTERSPTKLLTLTERSPTKLLTLTERSPTQQLTPMERSPTTKVSPIKIVFSPKKKKIRTDKSSSVFYNDYQEF